MKTLLALLILTLAESSGFGAAAANLISTLAAPGTPVAPGAAVTVDLVTFNRGSEDLPVATDAVMRGLLIVGADSWPVELKASGEAPATTVGPGRFAVRTYGFTVPAMANGRAVVELSPHGEVIWTAIVVTNPSAPGGTRILPVTSLTNRRPAVSAFMRSFSGRIAAHEPVYFIYGPDKPAAKFQLSFKYRLLTFDGGDETTLPGTLQFAFTQRSLWDINATSSPFYDTSYIPELMYESLTSMAANKNQWFTWLGYQLGYKHESNGRDGSISRSANTVYFRPALAFGRLDHWHLLVMPEIHAYVGGLSDNPDLRNYRGNGQLRLFLGRPNGPALMATGIAGEEFDHGSVQLDLTIPFRTRWLSFESFLLLQYFNGYGESLIAYNRKSATIRAGLSFVR